MRLSAAPLKLVQVVWEKETQAMRLYSLLLVFLGVADAWHASLPGSTRRMPCVDL